MSFFARGYSAILKIRGKLERKLEQINQPVEISDILVTKNQDRSSNPFKNSKCSVDNLTAHIKFLGSIANNYHERSYLSTENYKNKVTRLITSEFLFYPSDRPLTINEFKQLLSNIEAVAAQFHPNVMLVLSSFPVLGPKNEIFNLVVHVQGGPTPKIDTFCKASSSGYDIDYMEKYPLAKYSFSEKMIKQGVVPLLAEGDGLKGMNVNYGGIINCETLGGAKFTTAIDICLDHFYAVAKNAFRKLIAVASKNNNSELLPDQVSEIVTSEGFGVYESKSIVSKVTHVDSSEQGVLDEGKKSPQAKLSSEFKQAMSQAGILAPTTKMKSSRQEMRVSNPLFGPDLKLMVCEKEPLVRLKGSFKEEVDSYNATAIQNMTLDMVAMQSGYSYRENKQAVMDISAQLNTFLDKQSQQRPFFKKLFGVVEDGYNEQVELVKTYTHKIAQSATNPEYFYTTVPVLLANFKQHAKLIPDAGSLVQEIESIEKSFADHVRSSYQPR